MGPKRRINQLQYVDYLDLNASKKKKLLGGRKRQYTTQRQYKKTSYN